MISVPRGTTAEIVVDLKNADGNLYKIGASDKLIFGVKTSVNSDGYILSKIFTNSAYNEDKGGYLILLDVSDTKGLAFGRYVYDIGLQTSTGDFFIVCPCDVFEIADVVTEKEV